MLDRKFILQNADDVRSNCEKRGVDVDINRIIELDGQRLAALQLAEDLNRQANETSKQIPKAADQESRQVLIEKGRELRQQKDAAQQEQDHLDQEINELISVIPNMTHPDVPAGGEEDAVEIAFGKQAVPAFDFQPLDHVELGAKHDLFDFDAGGRVTGSGFYYLRNEAVHLDLALQQYAIRFLCDRGFTPVTTPDLALTSILEGIGFTPRGPETQIYSIENTELNLVGTAEITLGGMNAGQVLPAEDLPLLYCGLSHCFRTEAGAGGRA